MVSTQTMTTALEKRKGDAGFGVDDDMALELSKHRAAIVGHCYRMLGSVTEAEDAAQDALLRALRAREQFEGRSSLRTWLYRIATRVCLDALNERTRRARPMDLRPSGSIDEPLTILPGSHWIEPIADGQALPEAESPEERASLKQSIRLAFISALQRLPPRQRAVLLLAEVLDWQAAQIAESLETTTAAVNSALQRARATIASQDLGAPQADLSETQVALVARYVDAFERYDVDALTKLLHEDATMCMPPYELWLRGRESIQGWLLGRGIGCRGSRLLPTAACGSPAFGQYRPGEGGGPHRPWALIVLEVSGERIATMNYFLDTETLFPRFGLPAELP